MADTVWVVRHGQRQDSVDPNWAENAERVHDPPLTDLGRWAAWRVGRRFAESGTAFDAIYASPFLRTVETAEEICRVLGAETSLEPGLGEHRNPEWFDAEPETVPPATLAEWFDPVRLDHDPYVYPEFPESHDEAMARVGETARRLVEAESGTVLLVGHGLTVGGVVDGLVGSADGVEAPLCGLTRLTNTGDGWRLDFSGETTHLDDPN
jgi:broad specificity phosphatase PhoE